MPPHEWVVVDTSDEPVKLTMGQRHYYRKGNGNTMLESLRWFFITEKPKILAFVEDDDYYGPTYFKEMAAAIEDNEVLGLTNAFYYNVPLRLYGHNRNKKHSSLCTTVLQNNGISIFSGIVSITDDCLVDLKIWAVQNLKKKLLTFDPPIAVGIKGMSKNGITGAHWGNNPIFRSDPEYYMLNTVLGDADALQVLKVYNDNSDRV